MLRLFYVVCLVAASTLTAAELSEKMSKKLTSAEETYKAAVQKADNARFYAVQKARQERTKTLKAALVEATKAGDFDAATELKTRLTATDLVESITAAEWFYRDWGRFAFKADGTVLVQNDNSNHRWSALDEDSVLVLHRLQNRIKVSRFEFNKERTKANCWDFGVQGAVAWEAEKLPARK